ncbi:MAG: hypothetical protein P8Z41_09260, partial [Anaerolineales bacterium]
MTRKHRICLCRGNQDHFLVIEDARYSGKTVAGQGKAVVVVQRSEAKHYAVFIAVFTDIAAYVHFESSQSWDLRETDRGGSSIYDGQLNLAVRQPNSFFFTRTPAPEQDDFYFEVDIRSDVCEDGDEYGIMFRLGPLYNHYRFSMTCDGLARVSRILDDQEVVLIPPTETYAVFPGQRIGNHLA